MSNSAECKNVRCDCFVNLCDMLIPSQVFVNSETKVIIIAHTFNRLPVNVDRWDLLGNRSFCKEDIFGFCCVDF